MAAKNGRRRTTTAKPKVVPSPEPAQQYVQECYACPIGTASMALQGMRPEATEHFFRAGRELVLGLRGLVEGLSEILATMEQRSQSARIEHIPIRRA